MFPSGYFFVFHAIRAKTKRYWPDWTTFFFKPWENVTLKKYWMS